MDLVRRWGAVLGRRSRGEPVTPHDAGPFDDEGSLSIEELVGRQEVDLHLVLTGSGGGTWDVALGARSGGTPGGVPEVTIVAEALAICRLVADRIRPADLHPYLSGAVAHAPRVLAGAAALALD